MTRLFVAAWPSAHVRSRLGDLTGSQPVVGERRVPFENWHVTLRYLGNADIDRVSERLRTADLPRVRAVLGPAVIDLDGRLIVVPVADVDRLAAAVRHATEGLGERDSRPFLGHLTLARVRNGATSALRGQPIDGSFEIDEVALVTSQTLPSGAVYDTMTTFPTTGSAA